MPHGNIGRGYEGGKVIKTISPGGALEVAARIIDPKAWEFYDRHSSNACMNAEIAVEIAASVRTADAVLAALASSGDHAELARLAVVATDAASLKDGLQEAALTRFQAHANPTAVLALIAEVAALRGERNAYRTAAELEAKSSDEAERKLAELQAALDQHDQTASQCRIDGVRPQRDTSAACDLCGATQREICGRKGSAAYTFITAARTFLSKEAERG